MRLEDRSRRPFPPRVDTAAERIGLLIATLDAVAEIDGTGPVLPRAGIVIDDRFISLDRQNDVDRGSADGAGDAVVVGQLPIAGGPKRQATTQCWLASYDDRHHFGERHRRDLRDGNRHVSQRVGLQRQIRAAHVDKCSGNSIAVLENDDVGLRGGLHTKREPRAREQSDAHQQAFSTVKNRTHGSTATAASSDGGQEKCHQRG
jgi:hypothetical protein